MPQGTVLGPHLFLCHINDLPERVNSQIRLFADDCLLYRAINSPQDHQTLQRDLSNLQIWADDWGMKFNAKKCYLLSTKSKSSHFYTINDQILKQVQDNPYLGITFSENLKWKTHINNTSEKANSTIGFLRRNLRHCPMPKGGGGTLIFSYIRRLGPFFGVQNFEFLYFFGFSEK